MHAWKNNSENAYTTNERKHAACVYPIFTQCAFNMEKNKLDHCSYKDFMKTFCNDLKNTKRKKLITKKRKNTITRKQSK